MAIVTFKENKIGIHITGKLGDPDKKAEWDIKNGKDSDPLGLYGIYQMRRGKKKRINVREKFYTPRQTWSQKKQNSQDKFAAAVLAWQNLTIEQKTIYNKRGNKRALPGYNLFLREYMLT